MSINMGEHFSVNNKTNLLSEGGSIPSFFAILSTRRLVFDSHESGKMSFLLFTFENLLMKFIKI